MKDQNRKRKLADTEGPASKKRKVAQSYIEFFQHNRMYLLQFASKQLTSQDRHNISRLMNARDNFGHTILHGAIKSFAPERKDDFLEILDLLVKVMQMNINHMDIFGVNYLEYATYSNHNNIIVPILLDFSADINSINKFNQNLLICEIIKAHVPQFNYCTMLIKQGINLNHQDNAGNTAAHYFVKKFKFSINNPETIFQYHKFFNCMLDHGLNLKLRNKEGYNILDFAIVNQSKHAVDFILKHCDLVRRPNEYSLTEYLLYALRNNMLEFMMLSRKNPAPKNQLENLLDEINIILKQISTRSFLHPQPIQINKAEAIESHVYVIQTIVEFGAFQSNGENFNMLCLVAMLHSRNRWNNILHDVGACLINHGCCWNIGTSFNKCALQLTCKIDNIEVFRAISKQHDYSTTHMINERQTQLEYCAKYDSNNIMTYITNLRNIESLNRLEIGDSAVLGI